VTVSSRTFNRFYPDTSRSGTVFFYELLRRELVPGCRALNLGAGPGDPPSSEVFQVRNLRDERWHVAGCDPDPAVLANPQLDQSRVSGEDGTIPYGDEAFDLVWCDYVLEHVEEPRSFMKEVYRVMKPGGRFLFRTPNLWHYVSLAASLLPHSVHSRTANRARGLGEGAHEPYPTFHRLNRRRALRRVAAGAGFSEMEFFMIEGEPSYLVFSTPAFLAGVAYERIVNSSSLLQGIRANIVGRMTK
jgi:SAM-dependent methyltransferase